MIFLIPFISYFLIGIIAGTLAGLLGIGGGLIVVPALALVFSLQQIPPTIIMHLAAGTSLAAMVLSAITAVYTHVKRGVAIWPIYRRLAPGVIVGTIIGALLASFLPSRILEILFGVMVIIVSILMFLGLKPSSQRQLPKLIPLSGVALAIGTKSGLLGVGGGVITVPFLTYCNVPLRNAIGISTAVSLTIATIGSLSFMLTGMHVNDLPAFASGFVYWPAVFGIAIISPIFAYLGANLSHRLPVEVLRKLFAVFLLLVGIRMLI